MAKNGDAACVNCVGEAAHRVALEIKGRERTRGGDARGEKRDGTKTATGRGGEKK